MHFKNCHNFTKNPLPLPCSSSAPRPGCLWALGSLGSLWGEVKPQMVLINTWEPTRPWEGQGETGMRWKGGDSGCMEKSAYRAHTQQLGSCTAYLWQSWCLRHGMSGAVPHKLTRDFKTMGWDNCCSQSQMWGQGTKPRWIQKLRETEGHACSQWNWRSALRTSKRVQQV